MSEKYDKFDSIRYIIDLIEKNYAENHSVQEYADICRLDKYYFIKLFRECTGVSPHLYKTRARIEKAKELLLTTKMTNTEIATKIGYSTCYYFSRIFKSHVGISPQNFRKKSK